MMLTLYMIVFMRNELKDNDFITLWYFMQEITLGADDSNIVYDMLYEGLNYVQ